MATHSSVLAWRIPGMGKPGGLPSLGSHRVRHDWSDLAAAAADCRTAWVPPHSVLPEAAPLCGPFLLPTVTSSFLGAFTQQRNCWSWRRSERGPWKQTPDDGRSSHEFSKHWALSTRLCISCPEQTQFKASETNPSSSNKTNISQFIYSKILKRPAEPQGYPLPGDAATSE